MKLTLTQYLDAEPVEVASKLERAVGHGLDAAAGRIAAERDDDSIEQITGGIRIHGGLQILDGSELRVRGGSRLTILEFVVPWTSGDGSGAKFLAANAFSRAAYAEVDAAA